MEPSSFPVNLPPPHSSQNPTTGGSSSGISSDLQESVNQANRTVIPSINRLGEQLEDQMKEAIKRRNQATPPRSITALQRTSRSTTTPQQTPSSTNPLRACLRDDVDELRRFLAANPGINLDDYKVDRAGNRLLHITAGSGALECLKVLVEEKKANVDVQNRNGATPIALSMRPTGSNLVKQFYCFRYLLEKGARLDLVDEDGVAPIHVAVKYGDEAALKMIIDKSPESVNLGDNYLKTALHYAVISDGLGAFQTLLSRGANIEQKDGKGFTPFLISLFVQNRDVRDFLIINKANLQAITNAGDTAIHLTVTKKDPESLIRILDELKNVMHPQGFKTLINAKDKMQFTAYDLATPQLRLFLKEYGAEESSSSLVDVKCQACFQALYAPVDIFCGGTICRPCLYKFLWEQVSACPICKSPMGICTNYSTAPVKEEYIYKYFEKQVKERLLQGKAFDCLVASLDVLRLEWKTDIDLIENRSCQVEGLSVGVAYAPSSQQLILSCLLGRIDENDMVAKLESLFACQLPRFVNVKLFKEGGKTTINCQVLLFMPFASQETVLIACRELITFGKKLQAVLDGVVDKELLAERKEVSIPLMEALEGVKVNLDSLAKDHYAVDSKGGNFWEIQLKDPSDPLLIGVDLSASWIQLSCPILDHVPGSSLLYQAIPEIRAKGSPGTLMLSIKQNQLFLLLNFSLEKSNWDTFHPGTIANSLTPFIQQVRNWKQNIASLIKG